MLGLNLLEKTPIIIQEFIDEAEDVNRFEAGLVTLLQRDGWPRPLARHIYSPDRRGYMVYVSHRVLVVPADWPEMEPKLS